MSHIRWQDVRKALTRDCWGYTVQYNLVAKSFQKEKADIFAWRDDLYTAEKSCVELLPATIQTHTFTHPHTQSQLPDISLQMAHCMCQAKNLQSAILSTVKASRGCNVPRQTDVYSVWLFLAPIKAKRKKFMQIWM